MTVQRSLDSCLYLIPGVIVFILLSYSINVSMPIIADGKQNLAAAQNIFTHGVFSVSTESPPSPDMYREPLQPLLLGIYMLVLGLKDYPLEVLSSQYASHFKYWNIILIASTVGLAVAVATRFTKYRILPFVVITPFACALYGGVPTLMNRLNSEPLAMLLLLLASLFFARTLKDSNREDPILLGLCYALLTLTKAHFLFLSPFVLGIAAWRSPRRAAISALVFLALIAPWMARNYFLFGDGNLTKRGFEVLAVKYTLVTELRNQERECLAFAFTHPKLRESLTPLLNVTASDFSYGGKCQRLNRETLFLTALHIVPNTPFPEDRAARAAGDSNLAIQLFIKGQILGQQLDSKVLKPSEFFKLSRENLWQYIYTLPHFLYRGFWFTDSVIVCITLLAALVLTTAWVPSITVIALGSHLFHALLTHNITRYHLIETPVMLVCLVIVVDTAVRACRRVTKTSSMAHLEHS